MREVIINIVLVVFPILMYLLFSCYNALNNKKIEYVVFILTICTSFYLGLIYSNTKMALLISNIPLLVCYIKKEELLGLILSLGLIIYGYMYYDVNVVILTVKYVIYFFTYLLLVNKKEFNYLFLRISMLIQGLFILFEYFIYKYTYIYELIVLIIYTLIIYGITFFCLYLFKLASNISIMYSSMLSIKEDNKLKDSLFKLTHEIKNPIAVCKGYIDMININDKEKSIRYINIIKSEIDRSLNVMADFMEYSKIKINKEIIDVTLLLDDIYDSFRLLMDSKKITFNYQNEYDEVYIMADYDRLKQVFVNIIKNSMESIEKDGIINMELGEVGNNLVITVSDNGIGMDKEEMANIKEMFFTTKKNGTGLGVALSNEIVLAHGGMLNYESIKNKGTKCILTLPMIKG